MLKFNTNSTILPRKLKLPSIGFDADYKKIKGRLTDTRDSEASVTITINGSSYDLTNNEIDYDAPLNSPITCQYIVTPSKTPYQENTGTISLFSNHDRCKEFLYEDSYTSDHIKGYIGSNNSVDIPLMHNLVSTKSASITEFPGVTSSTITVSSPALMNTFYIKDSRITSFNIGCPLNTVSNQFSDMLNLESITGTFLDCANYCFCNCPKLTMAATSTENITNIGTKAFFNTPSLKILVLNTGTLPADTFSYDNASGVTDLQKVIFTRASTINGFTQKTLPDGSYTNGMLYYDPNTQTEKSHQVYCGLGDYWSDIDVADDTLTNTYDSTNSTLCITAADKNVLGIYIQVFSSSGTKKGAIYYFPGNSRISQGNSTNNYYEIDGNTKKFYISNIVYYDTTTNTTTDTSGTGGVIVTETITNPPSNQDKIVLRAISHKGLASNEYTYQLTGGSIQASPTVAIEKILYTNGISTDYTVVLDGVSRQQYSSGPVYNMWLTSDPNNTAVTFGLLNATKDEYIRGTNGNLAQQVDLTTLTTVSSNGRSVFILNLLNYYTASNLVSTYYIRFYYTGYTSFGSFDLPLTRQLTGNTTSL